MEASYSVQLVGSSMCCHHSLCTRPRLGLDRVACRQNHPPPTHSHPLEPRICLVVFLLISPHACAPWSPTSVFINLNLRLNFRVRDANKEWLPASEIILKRDITFNESQILAKESEENMLYRDMQNDMAQQIMRRLATITP